MDTDSRLKRFLVRTACVVLGALLGTIPAFIAYNTFLKPEIHNDLSDISEGLFALMMAGALGLIGFLLGALAGNRYAVRH